MWTSHAEAHFIVNNTSDRACWVRRTPRVVFAHAGGRLRIPRRQAPARVSIPAGTAAVFGVVFVNQQAFTPPGCPAAIQAKAIRVTFSPRAHITQPLDSSACPLRRRRPFVDPLRLVRAGRTDGLLGCGRLRAVETGVGPSVTGEVARIFRLTNTSLTTCTLRGYPTITALDRSGRPIPLDVVHGGTYAAQHRPGMVLLNPSDSAFFLAAKYRCDLGDERRVGMLRLRVSRGVLVDVHLDRFPDFSSCQGSNGAGGDTVDISPYAASGAATVRQQ